ncbi:hypothetical protein [Martelella mediterranea]|uniref:Uncharacterized protein n=1 Tax=Martelella mediterranea TaxID=293089 RepID=A0A4V2V317_9HYPH|nr:hypothetical protein [Martelella mediterranea]TCT28160.1 hypothetical protein EDC90_106610 [Martelella mediterranea]
MIYPLEAIFDHLPISKFVLDVQRNDELSGQGSGELLAAELAPPLWKATITLDDGRNNDLKRAAALIRSLSGSRDAFMVCDPTSLWPQDDFEGRILGAANVQVRATGADRSVALLSGFPAGYLMSIGDKIQFIQGSLTSYHEVRGTVSANAGGLVDLPVFPLLPFSLTTAANVTLIRPAFAAIVTTGGHKPGTASSSLTRGGQIEVIQKRKPS